jgi:hypothetical protein
MIAKIAATTASAYPRKSLARGRVVEGGCAATERTKIVAMRVNDPTPTITRNGAAIAPRPAWHH